MHICTRPTHLPNSSQQNYMSPITFAQTTKYSMFGGEATHTIFIKKVLCDLVRDHLTPQSWEHLGLFATSVLFNYSGIY